MNKKSAQKSRQDCERPIDSVKLIPPKVRTKKIADAMLMLALYSFLNLILYHSAQIIKKCS